MIELMSEFPPAPERQASLANWRTSPFNRWAFQHVREIVPSADIPHDPSTTRPLQTAAIKFDRLRMPDAEATGLTLDAFMQRASTDALVVLHNGRIVIERYGNGMGPRTPHILMSVSKSLLGLLTGILIDRGQLDADRVVTDVVPELVGTAYEGATIRHLLDMRTGVAFDEDYLATSGPIVEYRKSTNWNPLGPGETPLDLRSFYQTLGASDGRHGGRFHYISPNTDLLGWVVERAAGERFADLMSRHLWGPMRAECSACVTVDRLGAPRCAGGVCTTARDLARVGQLLVDGGAFEGTQVIPSDWIDDIALNGSQGAWLEGVFAPYFPGRQMHYRSKWYVDLDDALLMFGLGIHGQYLFVDRENRIVIAMMSSQRDPIDGVLISLTMSAVNEIRQLLT
jgi:CubicO group peptidase (beta-lactamase class C family)